MDQDHIEFMIEKLGGKEAVEKMYNDRPKSLLVTTVFPPELADLLRTKSREGVTHTAVIFDAVRTYFGTPQRIRELEAIVVRARRQTRHMELDRDTYKRQWAEVYNQKADSIAASKIESLETWKEDLIKERAELREEIAKLREDQKPKPKQKIDFIGGKFYKAESSKEPLGEKDFVCEIAKDGAALAQFIPDAKYEAPEYVNTRRFTQLQDGSWYQIKPGAGIRICGQEYCAECGAVLPGLGSIAGIEVVCEDCMRRAKAKDGESHDNN